MDAWNLFGGLLTAALPSWAFVLVHGWIGAQNSMTQPQGAPDWVCVNPHAEWQPRDSHGGLVYDGHLWVLGGWFAAQEPNPRDVWKSPDGKTWTRVIETAPWEHSDLSAALVFRGRMWFMGGRKLPGAENSSKVWSSTDGARWRLETETPGWSPRVAAACALFKDRMWILGGTENFYDHSEAMVKNDVWSSADGKTWRLEVASAPWSKRAHGQAVAFGGKLWMMGGGLWHPQHVARNDVWCSEDGVNWTEVTPAAPWEPRLWFGLAVYRDRMWVVGGWSKEHGNFNDVWCSRDGRTWTQVTSRVIWKSRHAHSVYVFQDRLWVAGGHAEPLNSEVWSLQIPPEWFSATGR
ncbi:MAG: galactose oxidase [Armatimonadota bacterium]|nr:galactose oxidase [Armatimonadota bacterium]